MLAMGAVQELKLHPLHSIGQTARTGSFNARSFQAREFRALMFSSSPLALRMNEAANTFLYCRLYIFIATGGCC